MYYVYILSNITNTTIYIGITNNLQRRVYEHENEMVSGFTKRYKLHKLVYFEEYQTAYEAITREKQLKKWRRAKKDELIKSKNPNWNDLKEWIK